MATWKLSVRLAKPWVSGAAGAACLCLLGWLMPACGGDNVSATLAAPSLRLLEEEARAQRANVAIRMVSPDGWGPECFCNDGQPGAVYATDSVDETGHHLSWTGCARWPYTRADLSVYACRTHRTCDTPLTAKSWLEVKKSILRADPSALNRTYDCQELGGLCYGASQNLNLAITIDHNTALMQWPGGLEASLPDDVRSVLLSLSDLRFCF